jgi:hypothetical protein
MPATFGDFIFAARADLDAAAVDADDATEDDVLPAMGELRRLVTVMARCADDLVPYGDVGMVVSQPDLDVWARAAVNVRDALRLAAAALQPPAPPRAGQAGGLAGPLERHLAGVTASLAAGRDLLQTHYGSVGGEIVCRSDWSDVITSSAAASALLEELAAGRAGWRRSRPGCRWRAPGLLCR